MFSNLKTQVRQNFDKLAKQNLFYVAVDRDEIWQRYLSGFSEDVRQEYNCNACKSFLRQWGGIVAINHNLEIAMPLFESRLPEGPSLIAASPTRHPVVYGHCQV